MKIVEEINCNGCGACYSICPMHCISMKPDEEGFLFPEIDEKYCSDCGMCKNVCPINKSQIERTGQPKIPQAFAVINKNEDIRMQSSSGGVFTLLSEKIIKDGGVVFGARFDESWDVVHDYTETIEGLAPFRGSKYVQSRIGDSYKKAREFLDCGRIVLFSGTPCQIGGLKSYLQKDYENLTCVDFICGGVSSPKVWRKYLTYMEKRSRSKITKISHRSKDNGWGRYSCLFAFANKHEYRQRLVKELFFRAYLDRLINRRSCNICGFRTINRNSDITIADFWGIEKVVPEMFDDKGTSLVLVHRSKGQKIFDLIRIGMDFVETDCENALKFNCKAFKQYVANKHRMCFMGQINTMPINRLLRKYTIVFCLK